MRLVLPGSRADAPGGEDNGLQREWRNGESVRGVKEGGSQEVNGYVGVQAARVTHSLSVITCHVRHNYISRRDYCRIYTPPRQQ